MNCVDPQYSLRLLHRLNVEIDRDGLSVTTNQHGLQNVVRGCIDLLMRHVRRDKNEISRICFGRELQTIAPAHSRPAANYVNDAFKMPLWGGAGLCIWLDGHGAGP